MGNRQPQQRYYSVEPADKDAYTARMDSMYTRIARLYDLFAKICPVWKRWIRNAIPYINGPKVLEVSFGTGYLLTQYAGAYDTHGVECNERLLSIARQNLECNGLVEAKLVRGKVEDLPYGDESFDSVIVTMAFSGYPDSHRAMNELRRVLKVDGRLIMVDVNFPHDQGNFLGMHMARMWQAAGDLIRDMNVLFQQFDFEYTDEEIGCFGSVHLYVATKKRGSPE